jgi:hypothetical protein
MSENPEQDGEAVAKAIKEAVLAEREACAKAVEDWWGNHKTRHKYPNPASVIRVRGA